MVLRPHTGALIYNGAMHASPSVSLPMFRNLEAEPQPVFARLLRAQYRPRYTLQFRPLRELIWGLVICVAASAHGVNADADPALRLAVAANFSVTARELAAQFSEDSGIPVSVSAASTGVLSAQIQQGAPFDLFLAADRTRPQKLASAGLSRGPEQCYARGSLVLLGVDSFEAARSRSDERIAIANPRLAPYGEAAMRVLASGQLARFDAQRIVMGGNVQQAFQFYRSGAASMALVARSASPDEGIPIPQDWHAPIDQYAIVLSASHNPDTATRFLSYLTSDAGRKVLLESGYEPCS